MKGLILIAMLLLISEPEAFGWQSGGTPGVSNQSVAQGPSMVKETTEAKGENVPPYLLPQRVTRAVNKRMVRWLSVSGEFRIRFEGRINEHFRSGNSDSYLLTRLRLDVDVHPTSWFRLFLEGQDSQAMGLKGDPDPPLAEDTFDLRQVYGEIFNHERQGFGVRIGRQELGFGDERLIGAFNWSNTARSFDAVRFFYARPRYRLDLFASSVVVIKDSVFNKIQDGANFYGLYGSFQNVIPHATVEGYLLWRTLPRVVDERGLSGDADVYTIGTRLAGKLPAAFDYKLEIAGQRGHYAHDSIRAWALHSQIGYTISSARTTPRLLLEYNFASGDRDPADGRHGTFDQLFPTNHYKYGIADRVGWRNMHNVRAGVGANLTRRLNVQLDYHSFWLASRRDALYNVGGAPVARIAAGAPSRHVGQELDFYSTMKLTSYLTLEAGYAHLFAGGFLKQATPGASTGFYYGMLTYRF